MLVEEDTLSSALNFRLSELAEDSEPALGVAGVLATSPAPHHGRVDRRHEATQTVARLEAGPTSVRADDTKTVPRTGQPQTGRPFVGKPENPRSRINLPYTKSTSPNINTGPRASTNEPGPAPESHEGVQNPGGAGSQPSNPTAPVPAPPTTPPVSVQPSQPTLPIHPIEPPIEVPPTPEVTISVPNTPVQISVPSVTVPPVNLPATDVSSAIPSIEPQVGG
jgi:hypothetical protein